MRKKIIYGILFITLFLVSTASMFQPVQAVHGYSRGIPDEAIGMDLQGEVKIYNEEAWEDSMGKGSSITDWKAGDADVVGARSMTQFIDFEDDEELKFVEKRLLGSDTAANDAIITLRQKIAELSDMNNMFGTWPDASKTNGTTTPGFTGPDPAYAALSSATTCPTSDAPAKPFVFMMTAAMAGGMATLGNFTNPAHTPGFNDTFFDLAAGMGAPFNVPAILGDGVLLQFLNNIMDIDQLLAAAGADKYDGTKIIRDKWEFDEDWETDEKWGVKSPDLDEDDWGPIFYDPSDRLDIFNELKSIKGNILAGFSTLSNAFDTVLTSNIFAGSAVVDDYPTNNFTDNAARKLYGIINATIAGVVLAAFGYAPGGTPDPVGYLDTMDTLVKTKDWSAWDGPSSTRDISGITPGTPTDWSGDIAYGLFNQIDNGFKSMAAAVENLPFDNKLAMMMGFIQEMPMAAPGDDYLNHHVEDFNIKDDELFQLPQLSYGVDGDDACTEVSSIATGRTTRYGEPLDSAESTHVYVYCDVSVEGNVVTFEIEYQDGQLDPRDIARGKSVKDSDELKDWELVVTIGVDTGGPNPVFKRGDTILWQAGGVDQIPGYEVTILLGVSAISVLALVYVIMKKRKR